MAKSAPPAPRFLVRHVAYFIALGCGSGLAPIAPGTFGTLFGWAVFALAAPYLSPLAALAVALVGFGVGVWACQKTGRALGSPDHGSMVWDEIVAIWIVLAVVPRTGLWQLVAVVVFRFFDIVKPPPIRFIDRTWKGGLGVMADDVAAAFYTLIVLAVAARLVGAPVLPSLSAAP